MKVFLIESSYFLTFCLFLNLNYSSHNNLLNKFGAKIDYSYLFYLQDAAINQGYKEGSFPVTEGQAYRILTLPAHQYLDETQLKYVINSISDFYS